QHSPADCIGTLQPLTTVPLEFQAASGSWGGKYSTIMIYLIKLLALGNSGVGKTSILYQYTDGVFNARFCQHSWNRFLGRRGCCTNLTATGSLGRLSGFTCSCGQERFRSLSTAFFRDAMGFLLVFDLTSEQSFLDIRNWLSLLQTNAYCDRPDIVLDLADLRSRHLRRAQRLRRTSSTWPYCETSACTGENVKPAIDKLLDLGDAAPSICRWIRAGLLRPIKRRSKRRTSVWSHLGAPAVRPARRWRRGRPTAE
uniref:RAB27B, member RAS oncogene family n=1 Tax=Macrostomum lignano TaxID=282301 RepID=A0A1I8FKF2_9PLAT